MKRMTQTELAKWLENNYTARELASVAGISTQAAYALINGITKPGKKTLDRLGLKDVVLYEAVK